MVDGLVINAKARAFKPGQGRPQYKLDAKAKAEQSHTKAKKFGFNFLKAKY